jgi:hypothetical protein
MERLGRCCVVASARAVVDPVARSCPLLETDVIGVTHQRDVFALQRVVGASTELS